MDEPRSALRTRSGVACFPNRAANASRTARCSRVRLRSTYSSFETLLARSTSDNTGRAVQKATLPAARPIYDKKVQAYPLLTHSMLESVAHLIIHNDESVGLYRRLDPARGGVQ